MAMSTLQLDFNSGSSGGSEMGGPGAAVEDEDCWMGGKASGSGPLRRWISRGSMVAIVEQWREKGGHWDVSRALPGEGRRAGGDDACSDGQADDESDESDDLPSLCWKELS